MLTSYYDERIRSGLPGKNVNTMAPILTIEYLGEYLKNDEYLNIAREWTSWLYEGGLPRTPEGGFQHRTTDDFNEGELWDDTLMMSVLPLANMGRIDGKDEYIEESIYQLLLHIEQLLAIHLVQVLQLGDLTTKFRDLTLQVRNYRRSVVPQMPCDKHIRTHSTNDRFQFTRRNL